MERRWWRRLLFCSTYRGGRILPRNPHPHAHAHTHTQTACTPADGLLRRKRAVMHTAVGYLLTPNLLIRTNPEAARLSRDWCCRLISRLSGRPDVWKYLFYFTFLFSLAGLRIFIKKKKKNWQNTTKGETFSGLRFFMINVCRDQASAAGWGREIVSGFAEWISFSTSCEHITASNRLFLGFYFQRVGNWALGICLRH